MAATRRDSPRDLIGELRRSPQKFRFFQAVRLLALAEPAARRRSTGVPADLRFRTPASLAFPASEVTSFGSPPSAAPHASHDAQAAQRAAERASRHVDAIPDHADVGAESRAPEAAPVQQMEVACLGLTGPSGILPAPYTELLIERRVHHRDDSAHAFLDLFSHRSLALFYAAWRKYRFHIAHERGEAHSFELGLTAITGMASTAAGSASHDVTGAGEAGEANKMAGVDGAGAHALAPATFLYYAGLLARRPVSASAFATLVGDLFHIKAELQQFAGHWIAIPEAEQSRLGSASAVLGDSACAGARVWDAQSRCRLRLGPMSAAKYDAFLPGRPGHQALGELVQHCFGHTLAMDLQLQLDRHEVPRARLASTDTPAAAGRLGQTLWLAGSALPHDPDDARVALIA